MNSTPPPKQRRCCLAVGSIALLASGLGLSPLGEAVAAPLGYKDSTTIKLDYTSPWSTADLNHALTTHDGVGLNVNWVEGLGSGPTAGQGGGHNHGGSGSGSGSTSELWSLLNYTRLLHRWNGNSSQANLWLDLGVGMARSLDTSSPGLNEGALGAGVSFDVESQRLYLALGAKTLQALSAARNQAAVKTGVALTKADFERIQPWLMVEVRGLQGTSTDLDVIPSLRLLHQRYVVELGWSLHGSPHLSLRYTF